MSESPFDREVLLRGAAALGVTLTPEQVEKLVRYSELVAAANEHINLTRIPIKDFVTLHLLDSLSVARVINPGEYPQILDAGTGAGFPGVVLAITYPHLKVILVDATRKKLTFIEGALRELGVTNATTLHSRLEDLGTHPTYRGKVPLITARALASLSELASLLVPLLAPGGKAVAYKGPGANEEIGAAAAALKKLSAAVLRCDEFILPETALGRVLVVMGQQRDASAK